MHEQAESAVRDRVAANVVQGDGKISRRGFALGGICQVHVSQMVY
jgi:hypothetical protein